MGGGPGSGGFWHELGGARLKDRSLLLAAALLGFAALLFQRLVDWDLYGHLTFGHAALQAGHVLQQDPYSFVPHAAVWFNHEWLWEVTAWLVYKAGGDGALLVYKGLCGALAFAVLAALGQRRQSHPLVLLMVLMMVALALMGEVFVRPYMATYALFPVSLYLLDRLEDWRWSAPLLVILFVGWANTHAGFVVGLGTVVIFAAVSLAQRRPVWRKYASVAGLSALLVCINPYGPSYWPFVLRAVTMRRPYITEYRAVPWDLPPSYDPFVIYKLVLALTVGTVIWSLLRKSRPAPHELLLLGITGGMSLLAYRHVPLFVLSAGAYIPGMLSRCLANHEVPHPRYIGPVGVVVGLMSCVTLLTHGVHLRVPTRPGVAESFLPFDAVRFIKANDLRGNIACYFNWGEFLIWELPDCKVSFDGRLETVYTEDIIRQNIEFLDGLDEGFAERMHADMVLVPLDPPPNPTDPPDPQPSLVRELMADRAHWQPVYGAPGGAALFVRAGISRPWVTPPQETDPPLVPLTGPPSVRP